MVRSLRIEYSGALYHITSRGDGKENIYLTDEDKLIFISILAKVCKRCEWICYAYCLMDNHYHLLIETPHANLSKGMHLLNGIYTQKFNYFHQRVGHVFQGRFKAILVEKNNYLLELLRYIVLNPVRAQTVNHISEWRWSSYLATVQEQPAPSWLASFYILSLFSENTLTAIKKYQQFVQDGIGYGSPWANLKNQIYLGSDNFVEEMLKKIEPEKDLTGIAKIQYQPNLYKITDCDNNSLTRNERIQLIFQSGQFSLKEIGAYFKLHYSTISRIVNPAF